MRLLRKQLLAACVCLCGACAGHTPVQPDELPKAPDHFAGASLGGALPDRWWSVFEDPALDQLIAATLAGNLDLKQAWARLRQSGAAVGLADADKYPQVQAELGSSRRRSYAPPFGDPDTSNQHNASLAASYEVDVWGRIGALSEAAQADATATRMDLESLAMSLAARVTETWFSLVEQRAQLDLLRRQIETNQTFLELIELRFGRGLVSAVDVYQQRYLATTARSRLPLIQSRIAVLEHQLAVLVGKPPGDVVVGDARRDLPELPELPATGVPASLLKNRPDLQAAHLRIAAADQRVAAAVAAQYPAIRLTGAVGFQADNLGDLIDQWIWNLAGNLVMPVFDGGRRKAEVARNQAVVEERLAAMGQLLLNALREVSDALVEERQQWGYLQHLDAQLGISQALWDRARQRYVEGLSELLPVLSALGGLQRAEQDRIAAKRQLLVHRIQLCRALGGRWTSDLVAPEPRAER